MSEKSMEVGLINTFLFRGCNPRVLRSVRPFAALRVTGGETLSPIIKAD